MSIQRFRIRLSAFLYLVCITSSHWVDAQVKPHAGMMRFPDVSGDKIVFVYGEDLWVVPRAGGVAAPLASPAGEEALPRFSPDGKTVAFVGNYDGNEDIYTIPVEGGPATRITYHPNAELLCDWTPDGNLIYSSSAFAGLARQSQLFVRGLADPLPKLLPVPYGTNGAVNGDGTWLAYTPHSHDYRTWKRYRGGMASDVWLFNLKTNESKQITDFEGTDSLPMWFGDHVYYVSDAGPEHRLNIWDYNTSNGERRQLTRFEKDDCKFPSIGPGPDGKGEIIVQNGASLYLVQLSDGSATPVQVTVPGDRPKLRPRSVDASNWIAAGDLSPTAKRVAVEARGDIWTIPAKTGTARNLTRTSGIAERDPSWSPDGKKIAYFSDATGEYELYVQPSDGSGKPEQLTRDGKCYRYLPTWSPDSRWIYFSDKTGAMWLCEVASKELKQIDREPSAGPTSVQWSHSSEWIVYARNDDQRVPRSSIWIYNVINGTKRKLTSGFFSDLNPTFDRKGDFIYFTSSRAFNSPKYEDVGTTFIYSGTQVLMAMPLRGDVKSPLAVESDEESGEAGKDGKSSGGESSNTSDKKEAEKKEAESVDSKPIVIDADGIESRAFMLPVSQGNFGQLTVNDKGQLIYARLSARGEGESAGAIVLLDLSSKDKKEQPVVEGKSEFDISFDRKKLLVKEGARKAWILDAAAGQKLDQLVPMEGMHTLIAPQEEWRQVLREAWRIERDFFYDPNMHGVDWPAIYDHYASMLEDCVSRRDVSFLIREMISELNVGHAYYQEGDVEQGPKVNTGLLGCRFELENDAYQIAEIYQGAAWDFDARNPLTSNGVKVGDYLLAVNGVAVDTKVDPYAAFQHLADKVVSLTISKDAKQDAEDRTVHVKLLSSDTDLRFRHWIEAKRKWVADKTDGRVGYIYVVNTGVPGQNDLVRQFYGQINAEALIIDERWNGGGQIPTRFIELLNRPATNFWAVRDGRDWTWSPDSHQGPKCMLINGMAGSGGDMFPALFKQNKLGKLIGTRTWGGLVGISGNPAMIDGSSVTAPTFAYYELDGTWGIEGHGVDPDIKVVDDPAKMIGGGDPQLDEAIRLMQEELKSNGFVKQPPRPAYPNRKGFGIKPEDK